MCCVHLLFTGGQQIWSDAIWKVPFSLHFLQHVVNNAMPIILRIITQTQYAMCGERADGIRKQPLSCPASCVYIGPPNVIARRTQSGAHVLVHYFGDVERVRASLVAAVSLMNGGSYTPEWPFAHGHAARMSNTHSPHTQTHTHTNERCPRNGQIQ